MPMRPHREVNEYYQHLCSDFSSVSKSKCVAPPRQRKPYRITYRMDVCLSPPPPCVGRLQYTTCREASFGEMRELPPYLVWAESFITPMPGVSGSWVRALVCSARGRCWMLHSCVLFACVLSSGLRLKGKKVPLGRLFVLDTHRAFSVVFCPPSSDFAHVRAGF